MRKLTFYLLVILLWGQRAQAQHDSNSVRLQNEGSTLGQIKTMNCVGAGIDCTLSGSVGTATVSGGGGGGGNFVAVTVDFGSGGNDMVTTTITGQTWVTISSTIICVPTMMSTADRVDGAEDALIEGLRAAVSNRVAGTGFDVTIITDGDITYMHQPGMGAVGAATNTSMHRISKAQDVEDLAFGAFLIHCTGG